MNNTITCGAGNDTIDGGAGVNTAAYSGARSAYAVSLANGSCRVQDLRGTDGTDSLTNIQRLTFADAKIALDISGHAGDAAKIMGAVLGPGSLQNAAIAGVALSLLDSGWSFEQLTQAALGVVLGPAASDKAVVDLLLTNLVGCIPSEQLEQNLIRQIASKTFTQVSLAELAANMDLNASNIDLVELASRGLLYA